jgi:polyhydroxyalkanoate synthesis regulator protein
LTRKNLAAFNNALSMFTPFAGAAATPQAQSAAKEGKSADEIAELKAQLSDMRRRLDDMSGKV